MIKKYAAIDIGTNSFHLIVAAVHPISGQIRIIDREKEMVRLGEGAKDMKHLSRDAIKRGVETLRKFKLIAQANNATIRAVATSAVREATNQDEFIKTVRKKTGLVVDIASGQEEARLIYLGMLQALPIYDKNVLGIDIGGGSTEFVLGKKRKVKCSVSIKLGAVRLTNLFFRSKKISKKQVEECRRHIRGVLSPIKRDVSSGTRDLVVGSSGTIINIARMIFCLQGQDLVLLNNTTFDKKHLDLLTEAIVKASYAGTLNKIKGLDPKRTDIILAGVLILDEIFNELKIRSMTISDFALREGVLLETVESADSNNKMEHIQDIRAASIRHLAEHWNYEARHSMHVTKLALQLFDSLKPLHKLDSVHREHLEAACILHEIGFFVSHAQHHLHSYYLIKNSELMGFMEREKLMIALIARYHRKSHPRPKHEGYSKLDPSDQRLVKILSSFLRIADGLDRTHSGKIKSIKTKLSGKKILIKCKYSGKTYPEMEIWGADRKKILLEEIFRKQVVITA